MITQCIADVCFWKYYLMKCTQIFNFFLSNFILLCGLKILQEKFKNQSQLKTHTCGMGLNNFVRTVGVFL